MNTIITINRIVTRTILIALLIMLSISAVGCADLQGSLARVSSWRNTASEMESNLNQDLGDLQSHRQIIPDDSPDAPIIDAAISQAQSQIQSLQAAIAQADLVINEAQNPSDPLTIAADSISPWIPAPVQGPLVLGAALFATMIRSQRIKHNATSIIESIDHAINKDPVFKERFDLNADTIRTIQTPGARQLIQSTQRKRLAAKPPSLIAR